MIRHPNLLPSLLLRSLIAAILLWAALARAEDWPKWRGPRGDGISREEGLLQTWPVEGPKKLWSVDVGVGFSSPIAVDGKVYLFTLVDNKQEVLEAFDAATGKRLWSAGYEGGWTGNSFPGTRATPVIEGDRIYTYGGKGDLVCRELAGGKELWRINILQQTGVTKPLQWGEASTPLIIGDLIYVQNGIGGSVAVAVDKTAGKIVWQSEAKGLAGYAHPILAEAEGARHLVIFAGDSLYGMDPLTGKTLWAEPWPTKNDVNATTPVYRDRCLFVSSGYDSGSMMLKLTRTGAEKLWEYRDNKGGKHIRSQFPGVVLDGDLLFANSEGTLKCMSWPDGAIKWQSRMTLGAGGAFVRTGDKLIALSERGKLMLIKADGEGAEKLCAVDISEGDRNWSTPLIHQGRLYVKTTSELQCFEISAKGP